MVIRRLGLVAEDEHVGQEALDAFARLFQAPLSRAHVVALAALSGFQVPMGAQVHDIDILCSSFRS